MSKVITIRLKEEEIDAFEKVPGKNSSEKLRNLLNKKDSGKRIPKNYWTKNELANYLGINELSKEYDLFMDKIEKVYYE